MITGIAGLLWFGAALADPIHDDLPALPPEHRLWLEYNQGLEDSRSYYGELDLVLPGEHHLLLGAGRSDVKGTDRRINLDTFALGFNTAYGNPFDAGGRYEFWGNTSELWTQTLSLPLGWNTRHLYLGVRPGYTQISVQVDRRNRPRRQVDTASQFIEGRLDWFGLPHWRFSLSASAYHYDTDLGRLQNPLARRLFSDVSLILAYGFPDSRVGGEIGYAGDRWQAGIGLERTVSAVDKTPLDVLSMKLAWQFDARLTLHLESGRVDVTTASDYNYLRLGTDIGFP